MADTIIAASLQLSAEQANTALKDFKQQLKTAQAEVLVMTEKFGATSKEAFAAAKRVAELKDQIGDSRKLIDSFNPDEKFRGVAQVLTGVAGGFSAITGAMGLLGAESEDVQKQLLKVQSALAITQGLDTISDSVQSFKNLASVIGNQVVKAFSTLKGAIISTGIGALVVAIGVLVANFDKIKEALFGVDRAAKAAAEAAEKGAAAEQKKLDAITEQDNILRLQGKTEEQILKMKIAQTDEVIHQREQQLLAQQELEKSQLEAAKRNHAILKGIIDFITKPVDFVLKTAARVSDFLGITKNAVDKVEKATELAHEKMANWIFDPDEVKKDGDEAIQATKDAITKLKNDRAGYQLALQKQDQQAKEAADKRKEQLKQVEEELAKIRQESYLAELKAGRERDVATVDMEAENEKKRIQNLKLAQGATAQEIKHLEELKTKLLEENERKRARRIKEIDEEINKQRAEEEKAALAKLLKLRQDNAEIEIKYAQSLSLQQIQNRYQDSIREINTLKISEEEKTDLIKKAQNERNKTLLDKFAGEQKLFSEKIKQEYDNALLEIKLSKDTEENKTAAVVKATEERNKKLSQLQSRITSSIPDNLGIKIEIDDTELNDFVSKSNQLDEWYNKQLKTVGTDEEKLLELQKEYSEKKNKLSAESSVKQLNLIEQGLLKNNTVQSKALAEELHNKLDAIKKEFEIEESRISKLDANEQEKTKLIENALTERNKKVIELNSKISNEVGNGTNTLSFQIKVDDEELKNFTQKNNDLDNWYKEQLKIVGDNEDLISTLQEDYENKKLEIVKQRGDEKLKIIADMAGKELGAVVEADEKIRKQKIDAVEAEFKAEQERINNLDVSEKKKTELLVQAALERTAAVNEINNATNSKLEENDKANAEKRRQIIIEEYVRDAELQDEQNKLKIERDYEASLKEIENLKVSEDTKTNLAIEAKKTRDGQLAQLEQDRIQKQEEVRAELENTELEQFDLKNKQLDDWYKQRLAIVKGNEELTSALTVEYEKQKTALTQEENKRRLQIASQLLGQAANLFAKHTAAYKVLAIAQTTIDTYSSAISAYKSLAGIPVVGPALGGIAAGLAIANGLKAIKEIVKTKVPGADTGGAGSLTQLSTAAPAAPLQPTPQIGTTRLDQESLNAAGNAAAPVRAFVLEADVTDNQERITRLNRAARLTG